MASSEPGSSDPAPPSTPPSTSRMTLDRLLRTFNTSAPLPESNPADPPAALRVGEAVSGDTWKVCKVEVPDEEMMTLEDFLARAGASVRDNDGGDDDDDKETEEMDVKPMQAVPPPPLPPVHQLSGSMLAFDAKVEPSMVGFDNWAEAIGGSGGGGGLRGKRTVSLLEPLDKAAQQRQRRMIKNRESAARSRERKQAYQVELESLAVKLEEENELLMKEKAERTKERRKQLMQRVVPFIEKQKFPRTLRRKEIKHMEVELGLKITHTREDLSSTADLRISKDAGGVLFFSRETEVMFFLTGHLRGYRWKNITISISEDGTRVLISGEKPVQEKVIQGWLVYKKEVELRRFTKVFSIPRGVVLDKIKAKFKEEGSVLTISMPKLVKGITGEEIEEIKEVVDGGTESSASGVINGAVRTRQHEHEEDDDQEELAELPEATPADDHITEPSGLLQDTAREERREEHKQRNEFKEEERTRDPGKDIGPQQEGQSQKKTCNIFVPAMAGSALLMSLIVFVINWKKPKQREM